MSLVPLNAIETTPMSFINQIIVTSKRAAKSLKPVASFSMSLSLFCGGNRKPWGGCKSLFKIDVNRRMGVICSISSPQVCHSCRAGVDYMRSANLEKYGEI